MAKITPQRNENPASLLSRDPHLSFSLDEVRPQEAVTAFFNARFQDLSGDGSPDGHLSFLLEDVRQVLAGRHRVTLPATPNAYGDFLRQAACEAVADMLRADPELSLNAQVILLAGPTAFGYAYPYHAWVEGRNLPSQTRTLVQALYTWLFTFLGKSPALAGTRFLDDDLTSPVALWFLLQDPESMAEAELAGRVRAAFISRGNFSPPVQVNRLAADRIGPEPLLTSFWVHGQARATSQLREHFSHLRSDAFYQHYQAAVNEAVTAFSTPRMLADFKDLSIHREATGVLSGYLSLRQDPHASVVLDLAPQPGSAEDGWLARNQRFFQQIQGGRYDQIIVEDATRDLGDQKGQGKQNQFTILKVAGLRDGPDFIPAEGVVLKSRGLSHYRGDINNWLDLIKEYVSYAYIHSRLSRPAPYLLQAGPMLLTCERLSVPFDQEETRNWIGFFLQSLSLPEGTQTLTCRVRRLSDFWDLDDSLARVLRAAQADNIQIDRPHLRARLQEMAAWLWSQGLCIDYCDLILSVSATGQIAAIQIADLERLNFSQLVDERHVLLEALVDIKTYLSKDHWYAVLEKVYRSREAGGYPSLTHMRAYYKPASRKRTLAIRILHGLRRISERLAPVGGRRAWQSLMKTLVRLN